MINHFQHGIGTVKHELKLSDIVVVQLHSAKYNEIVLQVCSENKCCHNHNINIRYGKIIIIKFSSKHWDLTIVF